MDGNTHPQQSFIDGATISKPVFKTKSSNHVAMASIDKLDTSIPPNHIINI